MSCYIFSASDNKSTISKLGLRDKEYCNPYRLMNAVSQPAHDAPYISQSWVAINIHSFPETLKSLQPYYILHSEVCNSQNSLH